MDSVVNDNTAAGTGDSMMGNGGGILVTAGDLTIINSTVGGNRALGRGAASGFGGGIWASGLLEPGNVTLVNTTIIGNQAVSGGGAVAAMPASCLCTGAQDLSGACERLLQFSQPLLVVFRNTIFAANLAPVAAGCSDCQETLISQGFNLEDGDTCRLDQPTDLTNTDPLLGRLADNGGPTCTHAPLPGSPAVDAGNCPDLSHDQRGYPRPVDHANPPNASDACDIGAVELQPD
jgi:hypothetical protein